MDMVLCGGIVGTGFTIVEDWMYSSGGLGVTIMRSLMPFHFMLGAIMGYFIGKSRHTGNILYLIPSIVVPVLLHAVYDGAINALTSHDEYVYLALAMMAVMLAVTVLMIVLINKWRKNGKLDLEMQ
jgi:RsiW-degrading membrane proteinase PrsW (M82 family)